MDILQEIKEILGNDYEFCEMMPVPKIKQILEQNNQDYCDEVAFVLNAGSVGIEMTLFLSGDNIVAGYDCCIKDWKLNGEWTSYSTIPDKVNLNADNIEKEMFMVLDKFVQQENLSYTDLNREKVIEDENGIIKY